MTALLFAILLPAVARAEVGYADVDDEAYPSWTERDIHLWTNAARVAPDAFEEDYNAAGCSFDDFEPEEQVAKPPLYYDRNLNIAARYHSTDFYENDWFSHDSSDGTSFGDRLARFYTESGYVGENIAYGYSSPYTTMMQGWMCSSGHRANIMTDYNELGTGAAASYYTQDFASGTLDTDGAIAMGNHEPMVPSDTVDLYVDWQAATAPGLLEVVIDGAPYGVELAWGSEEQGIYSANLALDTITGGDAEATDCHEYWFRYELDGQESGFPGNGSYLFGTQCESASMWVEGHLYGSGSSSTGGRDRYRLVGCSALPAPGAASFPALLGLAALLIRRRRR